MNPSAITTYNQLLQAVGEYLLQLDLETTVDPQLFIALGESEMNEDIRARSRMTKRVSAAFAANDTTFPLPANFAAPLFVRLSTNPPNLLTYLDPATFSVLPQRSIAGTPKFYTELNGQFEIAPGADGVLNYEHFYIGKLTPLATGTQTNELLPGEPLLYLAAALMEAYAFFEDGESEQRWRSIYAARRDALNGDETRRPFNRFETMVRI